MNFLMGTLCFVFLAPDQNEVTHRSEAPKKDLQTSKESKSVIWMILIVNFTMEIGYAAFASLLPQFHDPKTARGGFRLDSLSMSAMFS